MTVKDGQKLKRNQKRNYEKDRDEFILYIVSALSFL